jgi:23S rRNA (cytosine1962-C5)-methyltransferase
MDTLSDYELLDSGGGKKLERFGRYVLSRPCAQAAWQPQKPESTWKKADATFDREEGNRWQNRNSLPEKWNIAVDGVTFKLSGTDFGHLGIFPEQRMLWRWIHNTLVKAAAKRPGQKLNVLNMFAYSGGSTLAAATAGAEVCHLDASRGMVNWARENAALNKLTDAPIRWMIDDAHKYLQRETRRDRRYDAIILDPPTFGRGQKGELYKIEEDLPETLSLCRSLLTKNPVFVLLSAHTPGYSPIVLQNILNQAMSGLRPEMNCGEMLLTGADHVFPLPSGAFAHAVFPDAM